MINKQQFCEEREISRLSYGLICYKGRGNNSTLLRLVWAIKEALSLSLRTNNLIWVIHILLLGVPYVVERTTQICSLHHDSSETTTHVRIARDTTDIIIIRTGTKT